MRSQMGLEEGHLHENVMRRKRGNVRKKIGERVESRERKCQRYAEEECERFVLG